MGVGGCGCGYECKHKCVSLSVLRTCMYSRSHGKIAITVHRSPLEQRSPFTETTFTVF